MRWKRVAWVSCLAPAVVGCHTTVPAAHDRGAEKGVSFTEAGIEREIRRDAREAWRTVRNQYPNKAFTAEFHDGFVDGYVDYLDRGGDPQPPAVPPPRYTRNKRYFTPEGHVLIRDYFLGFKYGVDVAVATGHRQYLTVPVLIPDQPDHPAPAAPEGPLPPPPTSPFTRSVPAANPLPAPRALPADGPSLDSGVSKFGSATKSAAPAPQLPSAVPTISIPPPPGAGDVSAPTGPTTPAPAAEQPLSKFPVPKPIATAPPPDLAVKVPEPPPEVRDLPAGTAAPPAKDDLPVLPPNFTIPPPLPANPPDAVRP